jgi:hypothetical protein
MTTTLLLWSYLLPALACAMASFRKDAWDTPLVVNLIASIFFGAIWPFAVLVRFFALVLN